MVCIVNPKLYPTKRALRLWVEADPEAVRIENPSIFTTLNFFSASDIGPGQSYVVTNHPKRSWFARIVRKNNGTLAVE